MLDPYRNYSLIEQKRQQWAREREEMVGLSGGIWGTQAERNASSVKSDGRRNSLLPPILGRNTDDTGKDGEPVCRPEDESETSGYLSDSPKHNHDKQSEQPYWSENKMAEDYWAEKKMYKNYRNETWAEQSTDSWLQHQGKQSWYGTPESSSSDDGRAKWGDKGVGVGHLWEPVTHQPDSRLPQVNDPYRTTPKWVERGLKSDNSKADILVIHHSDEEGGKRGDSESESQKNFMLGQNVPLPQDIMEERERKRKKAQEHQNAIRKQLEERDRKRKEERECRMREERLEEERLLREQEIERLRYEEEQKRIKIKEEKERKKEEAMREALQNAEKMAQAAKKKPNRKQVCIVEDHEPRRTAKTPRSKSVDGEHIGETKNARERVREMEEEEKSIKETVWEKEEVRSLKSVKDSSCQFECLEGGVSSTGVQGLEGGLALVLDTPQPDTNLLMASDGVQLALLMSPGHHGQLIPLSLSSSLNSSNGRTLTPTKYRGVLSPRHKSTQTERHCCASVKLDRGGSRSRRHGPRSGRMSRYSDSSEKSTSLERPHAHVHCQNTARFRSRSQPRINIDERPKWGINRPSVQYKKQSEKDPYYQRRLVKMKQKKTDHLTEKLLESDMRLLRFETDEEDPVDLPRVSNVLNNGFRMTSNPSSPRFVRIYNEPEPQITPELNNLKENEEVKYEAGVDEDEVNITEDKETFTDENNKKEDETGEMNTAPIESVNGHVAENCEDADVDDDDEVVPGSVALMSCKQLEALGHITALRQGLENIQLNIPSTRSGTPYSDHSDV